MIRAVFLAALLFAGSATAQDAAAPPAEGKGRVIFYRTGGFYYGGRGCPIFEQRTGGAAGVAALSGGKYVAMNVDPGRHRFAISAKLKHAVQVEVEVGQTHYVRCQISGFPGGSKLLVSHRAEFERFSKDLEPSE